MPEQRDVQVCVVGAGPVGGALACRLASAGIATAIIDRAALPPMEHPDFDGRAYAIAAGSRAVMQDSGLWDRLPYTPGPITGIRVSDGKLGRPASPLFLHFDAAEIGDAPFGWMVEARSLRMALNAHMADLPNLHLFAPAKAAVQRGPDTATIQIQGGPRITARLVIAADGRRSALREQAGIPVTHLPYDQTGIVCCIAHDVPHHGVALEHFLPGGPFAQLPMAATEAAPNVSAPNVSAIVWTERTAMAAHIMRLDEPRFIAELARRLGDHLGPLRLLGRRWSYPLSAMLVQRYTAPRLALVGDAAHGIHPIAGQGLNLGFRDIAALANLLIAAHAGGEDLGAAALLRRYQAARRPDNLLMLAATDTLDRLFSNDIPPLRLARGLGIAAVHRIGPLKRMFMRRAMGALMADG
ncbi:MAG TPA: UbiH/UbiF/VisC/COQ6 family ubiquinone biosynthesis hydroxylase [Acetobacteraceae bacterium]|jgi:2-octaprenyl-6-methoxyphenol hydroxylase|nr:UbiH/UbiF/VisC/COQ6 family ubiquinone biosynthesis hydroxylase [Acetobacteraceae bacterium]